MLGRKATLIMAIKTISAILGLVGILAMSRYLTSEKIGMLTYTISLIATFNVISDLGFSSAHIKRLSEGKDYDDCMSTYITVRLLLVGLMAVLVIGTISTYIFILGQTMEDTDFELILLILTYYIFYDLAGIAISTFDAYMESAKSQISVLFDVIIRIPLIVFMSLSRMTAHDLAWAYVLGGLATLVVSMFLFSKRSFKWKGPVLFRSYMSFAIPIAGIAILGAVWGNLDKLLLGFFQTSGDVGYYSMGQSLLNMIAMMGGAIAIVAFPAFSMMHTNGDLEGIRNKTWQAEKYLSIFAMPLIVIIILFPVDVVTIFLSARFAATGDAIRFLSIATLLGILNQLYISQISSVNRPDIAFKMTLVAVVVDVIALIVLVPKSIFGIGMMDMSYTGAAIATALSAAAYFIIGRMVCSKLTGTRSNLKILYHVLAAIILSAILVALSMLVEIQRWWDLTLYIMIAYGCFIGVLYLFKEFTKGDLDFIIDLMDIKKMMKYIKNELRGEKN